MDGPYLRRNKTCNLHISQYIEYIYCKIYIMSPEKDDLIANRRSDYDSPNQTPDDFQATTVTEANKALESVLISSKQIHQRVQKLAQKIYNNYRNKEPIFVSIENGARPFTNDLIQALKDIDKNFISNKALKKAKFKSYEGTKKETLKVDYEPSLEEINWHNVIIIEDIVDTGWTMEHYQSKLIQQWAKSAVVCTLLNKPSKNSFKSTYIWFDIEDKFVIGYGMDHDGKYRDLPHVGVYNQNHSEPILKAT